MTTKIRKRQISSDAFYSDISNIDNTDSPYAVVSSDDTLNVDTSSGAVTVNLPAISSSNTGRQIVVRDSGNNAGTNNITVDANGSDSIDGSATYIISTNRETVVLESDGVSEWSILSTNQSSGSGSSFTDVSASPSSVSLSDVEYTDEVTLTNSNSDPIGCVFSISGADSALVDIFSSSSLATDDEDSANGTTTSKIAISGSGNDTVRIGRASGATNAISDASVDITQSSGNITSISVTASELITPQFSTWTSTRRALSSISQSGLNISFGSISNLIDNNFTESGSGGCTMTGSSGDYIQVDMGAALGCDGVAIYVGDDQNWGSSGTYTIKFDLKASNDSGFSTGVVTLATDIEFQDGGNVSSGTYLESADTTDATSGNWKRIYGWAQPGTDYRYFRFEWVSGAGSSFWYTTEIEFRVDQ